MQHRGDQNRNHDVEICSLENCQNTDIELTWLGEKICSACWASVCEMEQAGELEMSSTTAKKKVKLVKKTTKKKGVVKKTTAKVKAKAAVAKVSAKIKTPAKVKRVRNPASKWVVGRKTKSGAKILAVHEPDPKDNTPGHGRMITIECVITKKPRKIYTQDAHQVCTIDDPKVKAQMRKRRAVAKK